MQLPTILKCYYARINVPTDSPVRIVKDYEFDVYVDGSRTVWLDGIVYQLEPGSIMIRHPGQKAQGRGICSCYMLTLDFTNSRPREAYSRNAEQRLQPPVQSDELAMLPHTFKLRHFEECVRLMSNISRYAYPCSTRDMKAQYMTQELLHLLYADACHLLCPADESPKKLRELCLFMQQHCGEKLSLEALAHEAYLDKSYLVRLFRREMRITPMAYLNRLRIDNTKLLLAETNETVLHISIQCGFESAAYFCACFKKSEGMTPLEYRREEQMQRDKTE